VVVVVMLGVTVKRGKEALIKKDEGVPCCSARSSFPAEESLMARFWGISRNQPRHHQQTLAEILIQIMLLMGNTRNLYVVGWL
jgi:hypothetical protein